MFFTVKTTKKPEVLDKFGGKCLGDTYGATQQYLTKNGKPYICRMGEFHFSRYSEDCWEEELRKMQEGGIDVIASYLFWIHHEETEGEFRFDGCRDVGKFLRTCKKLGLPFVMRIGPWAHGEARNGSFPDWLEEKCGGVMRTDAEPYLTYVRRFFEQVYIQVKDDLDGILGIQLENELRKQIEYVKKLKEMLTDIGFSAPYWTFTGWGGSDSPESCPMDEVLFLYGGYPEAPWLEHIEEYFGCRNYLFSKERDDGYIGADLFGKDESGVTLKRNENSENSPFLTCELGGGNQVTYHRRPTIIAEDILSLAICKMGSGTNGLGYYVYHGGVNPVGKTTTQESRDTGYPNDLPKISYDFQAPLGEAGQVRKSYFLLKNLHNFVDYKGADLATMSAFFPDEIPTDYLDTDTLRCAVRSDGKRGYLFVSNHYHGGKMKIITDNVKIALAGGSELEIPVILHPGAAGIIGFNYEIGTEVADYITVLPQSETENELIFLNQPGIVPEICIDGKVSAITDGMTVGGKKITLLDVEFPAETAGTRIEFSKARESSDNSFFGHIVNYDGTTPEFAPVNEYDFNLPKDAKYLKINALGNIGALYLGDKLISDFYLYGDKWIVDVRRLPEGANLTLKILPLTEKDKSKIFMEFDMPTGIFEPDVKAIFDDIVYI